MKNLLASILLFITLDSAVAQDNIQGSPVKLFGYYSDAMKNSADKNYPRALVYLDSALTIAPHYPPIVYAKARTLELSGSSSGAWGELEKLIGQKQQVVKRIEDDSLFNENINYQDVLLKLTSLDEKVSRSREYIQLQEKDLVPEGITYDPLEKAFYVSSIYKRKIIKIDSLQNVTDFAPAAYQGLLSTLGMEVDPARRHLWVCSSYQPSNGILNGDGLEAQAAVFKFDLETGELIKKYELKDTLTHFYNDITILKNGDAYFTDSAVGTVYFIGKENEIQPLFNENFLLSANGITKDEEGENLFISSWVRGIIKYHIASGKWTWLLSDDPNANLSGIDGMAFYDGSLIVNSPIEMRGVIQLQLSQDRDRVTQAEILEYGNDLFGEPTTGEIVDNVFYYIANAGLGAYNRATGELDEEKLEFPVILKIDLNEFLKID